MNIGKLQGGGNSEKPKFPFQVEGTFDGVGALGMGFQTWGWGSRHKGWGSGHRDGIPDMGTRFQTQKNFLYRWRGPLEGWGLCGWDSRHEYVVLDMGFWTWDGDGVPGSEKFPLQVEGTFGDDIW